MGWLGSVGWLVGSIGWLGGSVGYQLGGLVGVIGCGDWLM